MTAPLTPAEVDQLLAPIVRARRIVPPGCRGPVLEVSCPFCGERHHHGAGARPGDGDGHRLAHCDRGGWGAGYVLREVRA